MEKGSCIECFITRVIEVLREVYNLRTENIKVLYDPDCRTLKAFNRGKPHAGLLREGAL
jgi:hypothetical protein